MTEGGYELIVARPAACAIAETLPEAVNAAVIDLLTGCCGLRPSKSAALDGVELPARAVSPVVGTAAFVVDGEDLEVAVGGSVHDDVGEAWVDTFRSRTSPTSFVRVGVPTSGLSAEVLVAVRSAPRNRSPRPLTRFSYQSCASTASAVASGWNRTLWVTRRGGIRRPCP